MTFIKILTKLSKTLFPYFQTLGFNLTYNHFYSPIPDVNKLNNNIWIKPSRLSGIDINNTSMIKLVSKFSRYKEEFNTFPEHTSVPNKYYYDNGMFHLLDASIYYSMIRHFKPKKIIEIGSGFSTLIAAEAILKNKESDNISCKLTAIEPYPNETLQNGFPGFSELIVSKVQDVDVSIFKELNENDILFMDSSHVSKIGSDVNHELFEILPTLNNGVFVHFHDIFLPMQYPKHWVINDQIFWNEQYLLQSFLMFNIKFKTVLSSNYMNIHHPTQLGQTFGFYNKSGKNNYAGSSFWIQSI